MPSSLAPRASKRERTLTLDPAARFMAGAVGPAEAQVTHVRRRPELFTAQIAAPQAHAQDWPKGAAVRGRRLFHSRGACFLCDVRPAGRPAQPPADRRN